MHFFEFKPKLNELNMAPGRLKKFAQQVGGKFTAGFEAECIFKGLGGGINTGEVERDLDQNHNLRPHIDWDDIKEFFELSDRDRSLQKMHDAFLDFWSEKEADWVGENIEEKKEELAQSYNDNHDEEDWMEPDDFEDEARDELQEEYSDTADGPSLYDWLRHDLGLRDWEDLCNHFDLDWPHLTYASEEGGYNEESATRIATMLENELDIPVHVNDSYHGGRLGGAFIIEPDSSIEPDDSEDMGCEIVSPPLPLPQTLDLLHKTLQLINRNGGYTNESTGLHINLSIEDMELDYVKLVLFSGDKKVLEQFGRETNTYTQAAMNLIAKQIINRMDDSEGMDSSQFITNLVQQMQSRAIKAAAQAIMTANQGKYVSVNFHQDANYVEFRSMGGEYSYKWPEIHDNVLRFARALEVAADPEAYKKEYAAKLYKLLMSASRPGAMSHGEGAAFDVMKNSIAGFAMLQSGQISKEQLKMLLRRRAMARWDQKNLNGVQTPEKPKLPK